MIPGREAAAKTALQVAAIALGVLLLGMMRYFTGNLAGGGKAPEG